MARGAAAGMAELDRLGSIPALAGYHPYHAARGTLLWRLARTEAAIAAYRHALGVARNRAEVGFLRDRLARIESGGSWPGGADGQLPERA